jgi:lantibiotic leader peptide-processing serine protease
MNIKWLIPATLAAGLLGASVVQAQAEQYLVVAAGNDFSQTQIQAVQQAGGHVIKVFPQIGVAVATSADLAFPARAQGIAGVQSVVPDPIAIMVSDMEVPPAEPASKEQPSLVKGADFTPLQWGLQAIQAPAAWALGFTGKGVRVAVLDGGIMTAHPDLAPNLNLALSTSTVPGETVEFIPGAGSGNRSHATHVAGIIAAAANGFGTTGVAPDAELVAIKIGSDLAHETRMSWVIEGILYAAQIRANIANMSFGVAAWEKNDTPEGVAEIDMAYVIAMRAALWAQQQGTLLVAAAGNSSIYWQGNGNVIDFPRDLPGVLAVAATAPLECWALDHTVDLDWPARYTDYGVRVIDFAAPGGSANLALPNQFVTLGGATFRAFAFNMVLSTSSDFGATSDYQKKGSWNFAGGTSSAAPHVCGVAALAIQAHGGNLRPAQVRAILQQSADDLGKPGNDDFYGAGRVNALRAVLLSQ